MSMGCVISHNKESTLKELCAEVEVFQHPPYFLTLSRFQ